MKASQVIIKLFIATLVPLAMGGRLGGNNKERDVQAANRRLAESRFLKAHPDAERIPEEYTIQFAHKKEEEGRVFVEQLLQKHEGAEKLFEYDSALQAVTILGISEEDVMDFFASHLDAIATIEEDTMLHATSVASWGLDRIDQEDLPLNNQYNPSNGLTGDGVDIYVLDTGVDRSHSEFGDRTEVGADFTGQGAGVDPHGHGTHVAGTAAGSTYGVANGAKIIPVRVLNSGGSGSTAQTTAGINWAVNEAGSSGRRSVINMSLGGFGSSSSTNTAIKAAVDAGVVVVVAAGNDDDSACKYTPANAASAFTVASSTSSDARSYFSNYGGCVNIFAPGSAIPSARTGGGTVTLQGTSMASPHVAGAAALLLEANPTAYATEITSMLVQGASDGKITDVQGSPNKLLNVAPGSTTPPPTSGGGDLVQSDWTSYVNEFDEFFYAKFAAPSGQRAAICGISSYHSNSNQDRRFRFKYCYPKESSEQDTAIVTSSDWSNFDTWFYYNCPDGSFISRITSYHSNTDEDRRFQYNCHKYVDHELSGCYTTNWVNSYNGAFDFAAEDGYVINGFESVHHNQYEDRGFKFRVCKVDYSATPETCAPRLIDNDKKCPYGSSERAFRVGGANDIYTVETCNQACLDDSTCNYFSIGGSDSGSFEGVCIGCVSPANPPDSPPYMQDGFDYYEAVDPSCT